MTKYERTLMTIQTSDDLENWRDVTVYAKWTKEPPSKPGMYQVTNGKAIGWIDVFFHNDKLVFSDSPFTGSGGGEYKEVVEYTQHFSLQWLGPIPLAELPKE